MNIKPSDLVGRLGEAVLYVLWRAQRDGKQWVSVREILQDLGNVKLSSLYITLDRLEVDGFVSSHVEGPTGKPGGRSMKMFQVSLKGLKMLISINSYNEEIRRGTPLP